MSFDSKMLAIADAIREKTNDVERLTLDDMAASIPQIYALGEAAASARCAATHFVAYVNGNDSSNFSVPIPFAPDAASVLCYDAYGLATPSTYLSFLRDFRAASTPQADILYVNASGVRTALRVTAASAPSIFAYADGELTFTAPAPAEYQAAKWRAQLSYIVTAVKYTDKTDKQLITEQIEALPASGGSVTFSQREINAAFTDAEWDALTDTKPAWTFVLA